MTITAADIKIGMCIEMDGKTFLVVDFQHCKPGKGPAFVRSKLKNLENGRVLENRRSSRCASSAVPISSPMRMTWEHISCTPRLSRRSTSTGT